MRTMMTFRRPNLHTSDPRDLCERTVGADGDRQVLDWTAERRRRAADREGDAARKKMPLLLKNSRLPEQSTVSLQSFIQSIFL